MQHGQRHRLNPNPSSRFAVMLPYTPLYYLLFAEVPEEAEHGMDGAEKAIGAALAKSR